MTYFLTEERLTELKTELEKLATEKRIEVSKRLKRAKELGDLSENAEYTEARNEQERVENRISELKEIIENAEIIKKGGGSGLVNIGSTVEVEKNGKRLTFSIVGSNEARPDKGYISNESPLGSKLINRRIGEVVSVDTPDGRKIEYKIVKIS
ncbi:MAG: transcription elongation factor GreA [Candidatus Colwellbacteria bacterium]|nr:transcription elongation factor GreA [Candidatus Colwellbacteria bacterium]